MRINFDVGGGTDGQNWPFPWTKTVSGTPTAVDVHSGLLRISMPATAGVVASMMYQQAINPFQWEIGFRVTPSTAWGTANTCRVYYGVTPTNTLNINALLTDSIYGTFQTVTGGGDGAQQAGTTQTSLCPNFPGVTFGGNTTKAYFRVQFVFPYISIKAWNETSGESSWYQEPPATFARPTVPNADKSYFPFILVNNNNAVARDYSFDLFYFDDLAGVGSHG